MFLPDNLLTTADRIKSQVLERLKAAKDVENRTFDFIADKAGSSKTQIHDIYHGKKPLTLSMALKIWEGLGENPVNLFRNESDPLIQRLAYMTKEKREVVAKLIDLIETEKDIPSSVNSLISLIDAMHFERFKESPPPWKPHNS